MTRALRTLRRHAAATAGGTALVLLASIAAATPGAFGGFSAAITNSRSTAATATYFTCAGALAADAGPSNALFQWPLNDPATSVTVPGASIADVSGANHTGTHVGTVVTDPTAPLACPRDTGTSWSLDGSSQYAYYPGGLAAPMTFTLEIWFRTTVAGGKLIGFGSSATGASGSYDRHLYINSAGQLVFGVYTTTTRTISTTAAVNDGAWHQAVATLSGGTGTALYLDGRLVASDTMSTMAQTILLGYWRVGYDNLNGWPGAPANPYFRGRLRYAAVYTSVLSAAQIQRHFVAGS